MGLKSRHFRPRQRFVSSHVVDEIHIKHEFTGIVGDRAPLMTVPHERVTLLFGFEPVADFAPIVKLVRKLGIVQVFITITIKVYVELAHVVVCDWCQRRPGRKLRHLFRGIRDKFAEHENELVLANLPIPVLVDGFKECGQIEVSGGCSRACVSVCVF